MTQTESLILEGRIVNKFMWGNGEMCQLKTANNKVYNVEIRGKTPHLMDLIKIRAVQNGLNFTAISWGLVSVKSVNRPPVTDFDGETYDSGGDRVRLNNQLQKVFEVMFDGKWRTLKEIEEVTAFPQASISARLRDLRKPKFGSYTVDRRLRGSRMKGLYEYYLKI